MIALAAGRLGFFLLRIVFISLRFSRARRLVLMIRVAERMGSIVSIITGLERGFQIVASNTALRPLFSRLLKTTPAKGKDGVTWT